MKYKVIKEYERYYLSQDETGRKECFDKIFHKPDKYGYIVKKIDSKHEKEFYSETEIEE